MNRTLLLGFICVLFAGCGGELKPEPAAPPQVSSNEVIIPPDSPKLAQIRVEPIKLEEMPEGDVTAPGKVEVNSNRVSRVPLPVAGRVLQVLVKLGDSVAEGQPLLMLDSPEANAAVTTYRQSESAVTQASASLSQASASLVKAQADYDRSSDLLEHGSIAKKEVINADSALKQSKAAVELAGAGVEQAKVARAQALKALGLLGITPGDAKPQVVVRSPLAGKVLEIGIVAGEYRNDTTAPVLTIADLRRVWMTSDVPENSIRLVSAGEFVDITLDAYPDQTFGGRVSRVADTLDPKTRTIKVMIELDNARGLFKPEMFGRIRHLEAMRETPAAPIGAIIQDGGKKIVYVERGKGKFEAREVVTGHRSGDLVAIVSGLQPGERVVVDGVMLLRG
ncbi:MAG: efflux RND transporter periplasmic adaptor subunit [Chloracidobacterium sp.]|nr:efflux RND transporter periplasmic adaptor subunit [Chloracidobacterium sp.]